MNDMQSKSNSLIISLAIIVAGGLIAGAVFFSNKNNTSNTVLNTQQGQKTQTPTGSTDKVNPITSADHIRGNINAPVKIVEYSDFECPFCKRFHTPMKQVMDEYGKDGRVAWVYRHFPLDQLHPKNARKVAVTSECVAEIGGNDSFWQFADKFFEATPSNDRTDLTTVLPQIYNELGLNKAKIEKCVASGKYDKHIQDDIDNALATGGRGTPWSIVISSSGETFPLSGAQPYTSVKQLVDIALKSK